MTAQQKADLDNGYTKIANELLEALFTRPFTSLEKSLLLLVMRETYGWRCKHVKLTIGVVVRLTGSDRSNVSRTFNRLLEDKILSSGHLGISINTNLSEWDREIEAIYIPARTMAKSHAPPMAKSHAPPMAKSHAPHGKKPCPPMAKSHAYPWQKAMPHGPSEPDSIGIVGVPKEKKEMVKETTTIKVPKEKDGGGGGGGGGFCFPSWLPEDKAKLLTVRALKTLRVPHLSKLSAKHAAGLADLLGQPPPEHMEPEPWALTILEALAERHAAVAAEKREDPDSITCLIAVTLYRTHQQLLALAIEPEEEDH